MNLCVIITAAGRSERFGSANKLDQDLGGRPLLLRCVELFTKLDEVRSIVVAGPPDGLDEFKHKYGAALSFHGGTIVAGGKQARWETVQRALEAVPADATHVAVHDAARPAASPDLLSRVVEAARSAAAVIPVVPVAGTVKRVADEATDLADHGDDAVADAILGDAGRKVLEAREVRETVDRRGLVEVQTPQIFEADLIRRAYAQEDLDGATDDAALVERLGETVQAVEGEVTNIKVTKAGDLKLVRCILGVRPPSERPVHKRF
jgi:2-C-methyl-D-erythritol 4-phosphate cytidylyltransferase